MSALDDNDIQPLREACRIAYEALHRIVRETPALSVTAAQQIVDDADAIMRAWNHIPDTFKAVKP